MAINAEWKRRKTEKEKKDREDYNVGPTERQKER